MWFKIYESGLKNGGQQTEWGSRIDLASSAGWDQFQFANNGWSITIPKNLKPGNYLIRHGIIMIELMPPQFYPECAHLTVSGDGDKLPAEEYLVSFPGAYSLDGTFPLLFQSKPRKNRSLLLLQIRVSLLAEIYTLRRVIPPM